jgi:DNA-directed RNA polymerase subunit K
MIDRLKDKFTRYEVARILGARSLQLAMDAPVLLKLSKEEEEELNYDSLRIAERELESGVLPITVRRPLPKRSEKVVKKLSKQEIKEKLEEVEGKEKKEASKEDKIKEAVEAEEEKEIAEEGEIMAIANPEDETDEADDDVSELEI